MQTEEQAAPCRGRFGREPIVIKSIVEPAAPQRSRPEAFLWIGSLTAYKQPLALVELARVVPEARFWMVAVPGALARRVASSRARSLAPRGACRTSSCSSRGRAPSWRR